MPLNNPAPAFGLLTAYDLRQLSAKTIFSRSGGSAVSLPTFSTGDGVYEDAVSFLNGRALHSDMTGTGRLTTVKLFGASWALSLSSSDKFVWSSNFHTPKTKLIPLKVSLPVLIIPNLNSDNNIT